MRLAATRLAASDERLHPRPYFQRRKLGVSTHNAGDGVAQTD